MDKISERIKLLRKEKNWSQGELGEWLSVLLEKDHIPASTISGYESGYRQPDTRTLVALAKLFNITVDYLTGFSDSRYPSAKISGDDVVDLLAAKFASMAKPRIDRAKILDDDVSSRMRLSEKDIQAGISYSCSALANSAIFSYLHYAIDRIGEDIDSCLDNSDRWINVDLNGQLVYNRDLAAGMLSNDYLKYVIECDKEKVIPCQDQQKTPDQSESVQTELGKDD